MIFQYRLSASVAVLSLRGFVLASASQGGFLQQSGTASRFVEQTDAVVPIGGQVKFSAIGSSNVIHESWVDQLHRELLDLGYEVYLPELPLASAKSQPWLNRVCDDEERYSSLETPRLGLSGWRSWGFAYESFEGCVPEDGQGYRSILGRNISCMNGYSCTKIYRGRNPLIKPSELATTFKGYQFLALLHWINDVVAVAKGEPCLGNDEDMQILDTAVLTVDATKKLAATFYQEDPTVMLLVMAHYGPASSEDRTWIDDSENAWGKELNRRVREGPEGLPNVLFVDYVLPPKVDIFNHPTMTGHPNCRGDKFMVYSILETLYNAKVLSRGFAMGSAEACSAASNCEDLDLACCHSSALCFVNATSGACLPYSAGAGFTLGKM